jgi:tetratricopeptide (TPR) repeat protein
MVRYTGCLTLLCTAVCVLCPSLRAAEDGLFSQNAAALFARQAQELYRQDPLNSRQVEQAMTLLDAAIELDERSMVLPEMVLRIGAAACFTGDDYTGRLAWALERYMGKQVDLEVAGQAVRCMLEHLNSRQEREELLQQLLRKYDTINSAFASELATQLGLLAAEKADMEQAIQYLSMGYQLNRYNQLAFIKLQELTAGENLSVTPEAYLLQLRTALDINPYDLTLAVHYAQTLMRLQLYEFAEKAFDYAARLYEAAYPDQPLPDDLLALWLTSCNRTARQEKKCVEIADKYRQKGQFNLILEALAARAAARTGQAETAQAMLEQAGQKAESLLEDRQLVHPVTPEQAAWFFSFVLDQPDRALAWANQAYQEAPDRQGVRAMFAYTLAVSGQADLARTQAEPIKDTDQVAALTMALVSVAQNNKPQAIEQMRSAIGMEPYSFVAEKAHNMLRDLGSDYVVPMVTESARKALASEFVDRPAPTFMPPSDRFKARLMFSGSEFFYGTDFTARLVIENTGSGPLVINDAAFLSGSIRVDAVVTGDFNVEFPNLVQMKFKPSRPVLAGEHISIPMELKTGKLLKLLATFPQAALKIEYVLYLDPVEINASKPENRVAGIDPIRSVIQRPRVQLSRSFLMQRLEALAKGQEGQRYRAVELLAGLLAEQKAFERTQPSYQYTKADQTLLVDTVRKALVDENWRVRIQTMDSLMIMAIPLEFGMVREISDNLNHDKWPVRLMAMLVLAKSQPGSFDKVLEWAAQYDPYWLNRRMAMALQEKRANQP